MFSNLFLRQASLKPIKDKQTLFELKIDNENVFLPSMSKYRIN